MENRETIEYVNTGDLIPFQNHPFKLRDGEEKEQLLESIKAQGTIEPLIVRPSSPAGKYEIVSGHRRMEVYRELGIEKLPVIVRNLTDEQAVSMMADANLHRENILPSEKAFAYKMKMDALNHQGVACGQIGHKSRDEISDTESGRTVQRSIRLTYLIPELLDKMEEGKMALSMGVELSYLEEWAQREVLEQCERNDCIPSYSQAWRLHKADREGMLTQAVIEGIMSEEKANQRETVKISAEKLRRFVPNGNPQQLEDFVLKACEHYRKFLIRQRDRER